MNKKYSYGDRNGDVLYFNENIKGVKIHEVIFLNHPSKRWHAPMLTMKTKNPQFLNLLYY